MLHYAGNEHVDAVGYSIYFELRTHKVLIAEYGIFNLLRQNDVHISFDIVLREGNGHILTAYDVRRTEKHGIAQLFCRLDSLLLGHYGKSLGSCYVELFEQFVESLPVLSEVYAVGRGTEYSYALLVEIAAQLDCRLSAEGYDHAIGLFNVYDALDVFGSEALEIQSVSRIEVG